MTVSRNVVVEWCDHGVAVGSPRCGSSCDIPMGYHGVEMSNGKVRDLGHPWGTKGGNEVTVGPLDRRAWIIQENWMRRSWTWPSKRNCSLAGKVGRPTERYPRYVGINCNKRLHNARNLFHQKRFSALANGLPRARVCLWGEVWEFVCMQFVVVVCCLFVCLFVFVRRGAGVCMYAICCCLFVCVCEFVKSLCKVCMYAICYCCYCLFVCLCLLVCEGCMQGLYVSNLLLPLLVMLFVNLFVFENIETCMSPFCMSFMNMYVLLEVRNGLIACYKIQALFCFVCGAFFSA